MQRVDARAHRRTFGDHGQRFIWHVLELECHDIDGGGKRPRGIAVFIGRCGLCGGYFLGRRIGVGTENMAAIAKGRGGEGGHPAQLSAAQNTDGGTRRQGCVRGCIRRHVRGVIRI